MASPALTPNKGFQVTNIITISCYAVAVWDCFVCLPQERKKIWKRGKIGVKSLYLVARYYTIISQIFTLVAFNMDFTKTQCAKVVHFLPGLSIVTILACNLILATRCYAIWRQDLRIAIILGILLLAVFVCCVVTSVVGIRVAPFAYIGYDSGPCIPWDVDEYAWSRYAFYGGPAVFDMVATLLAVFKCYLIGKEFEGARSNLLAAFWKHGVVYFLAAAVINTVNIAMFAQSRWNDYELIFSGATITLTSVFSCRLLLALRSGAHVGHSVSYTTHMPTDGLSRHGHEFTLPMVDSHGDTTEKVSGSRGREDDESDIINDSDARDAVMVSRQQESRVDSHV